MNGTLPPRDPRERFTDRAADYARFRPTYPVGVLDVLEEEIGFSSTWEIADVGAGTGLSTELLLDHGNVVVAVEPNAAMRAAADARLAWHPRYRSVPGSAEATGLGDRSVDLVFAAQAFHWFDPEGARREFRRILRDPAWAVFVWNLRRTEGSPFTADYQALIDQHRTDRDAAHGEAALAAALERFFPAGRRTRRLPHQQRMDLAGLRGRLASSSYLPGPGAPGHAALMEAAGTLFRRHAVDGAVVLTYNTEVHIGRMDRAPAP